MYNFYVHNETYIYTVPCNVDMIQVQLWGGGGAGAYYYQNNGVEGISINITITITTTITITIIITVTPFGGGAGGYTTCLISVSSGQEYYIIVGQGGQGGTATNNAGSGNASQDGGDGLSDGCSGNCGLTTCQCYTSGGGGGRSAIQLNYVPNDLVTGKIIN